MKKNAVFKIDIPVSCHESWDEMSPTEQGRFCGQCTKKVVDFTTWNEKEIVQYMRASYQPVCGRFRNGQLNRDLLHIEKERANALLPALIVSTALAAGIATNASASENSISQKPLPVQTTTTMVNAAPADTTGEDIDSVRAVASPLCEEFKSVRTFIGDTVIFDDNVKHKIENKQTDHFPDARLIIDANPDEVIFNRAIEHLVPNPIWSELSILGDIKDLADVSFAPAPLDYQFKGEEDGLKRWVDNIVEGPTDVEYTMGMIGMPVPPSPYDIQGRSEAAKSTITSRPKPFSCYPGVLFIQSELYKSRMGEKQKK